MNIWSVVLNVSPQQQMVLANLRRLFADACNELAGIVQDTRCWNRVALHHMTYKKLRQSYPQLGSQMVCNVIYSVCRNARLVYQHPDSPYNIQKTNNAPLPRLMFGSDSAVYFDKHTLSILRNHLSMYTLEGRIRFELTIPEPVVDRFKHSGVKEISLENNAENALVLRFIFLEKNQTSEDESTLKHAGSLQLLPSFVSVQNTLPVAMSTGLSQ